MARNSTVAEVMTTEVVTFGPDDNVQDAIARLIERDVDAAPVVDDDGRVVGMLSTGDIIVQETQLHFPTVITLFGAYLELPSQQRHFEADLQKALGSSVAEVMTAHPATIGPGETIERAATVMHDKEVSRLPVVEDDRLIGIISRGDIVRALVTPPADAG
ncbi:MAG: CBS domain-containing protein [Acidimicrobiales bacterium]